MERGRKTIWWFDTLRSTCSRPEHVEGTTLSKVEARS